MASGSKKVIYAALVGNFLISITKLTASFYTGSKAMFTEAIHSFIDTTNQLLLLWGLRQAKQPPNDDFPFGRGKEIYFWSFVVAIMIFAVGSGISIYEGVKHTYEAINHPEAINISDPTVNYIVLGLAMIFEGFAWGFAFKEFRSYKGELGYFEAVRNGKDPTMFVVLFEDTAAMLGLVFAFIGVLLTQLTGNPVFDGAASIVIGVLLGVVAYVLARETKGLLIGESAASTVRMGIIEIVKQHSLVKTVNEVLTMHMGPEFILVTMSVDFKDDLTSQSVEAQVGEINDEIKAAFPDVRRVFIEVESLVAHQQQVIQANKPVEFDDHSDEKAANEKAAKEKAAKEDAADEMSSQD